ncbi:E3 ubiquitin-protein ligase MARCHF11 [Paramormyrops kingsleyae]|uniref:RING-type E3 ubiquitin transferase n=1 Tax=Paramormyrops kingsleyae TaxID=1676925 RepID=A0A3B3S2E7_9TELE|nr:E3 ubiquitin-protein ligase MARCH11 [Paramormyrops kingsleyae]
MSREAEVGPVCRGTEGEPQGGAAIIHSGAERDPSDLEGHLDTGISHGDGEDGERVDVNPEEGHSGCLTDPDGEACCLPSEELSGQSPDKAGTLQSDCSSETCIPTPSCRICFQGAEQGQLLNPCRCDGSVRHTHQQCLLKWISERGSWTCELCCYRFHVVAIKMKKPWQWQAITITLVEKVQIIAVFLGSLFLVSSVTWLLWSAFSPNAVWQRRDVLFQICYGMYGFMDLVCIGLIVHEGAAVHKVFKRWRAVNLHWDVQNYDKEADVEESSGGASGGVDPGSGRTLWLPLAALQPGSALHPTQLVARPSRCSRAVLWLCAGLAGPQDSEADAGEVVIRVTSV